jgi:hypothetical protein
MLQEIGIMDSLMLRFVDIPNKVRVLQTSGFPSPR